MTFNKKEWSKFYYLQNREKILSRNRNWLKKNPDKVKSIQKNFKKRNPESIRLASIRFNKNHPERRIEISLAYRKRNQEERNRQSRLYYQNNKEYFHQHHLAWSRKNKIRIKVIDAKQYARRKGAKGTDRVTAEEWQEILRSFSFKCGICKKRKVLEMDHIIPLSKGGVHLASNIQPLCRSCNSSKGNRL